MFKMSAVIMRRSGDVVEYWLNATVSVNSVYQHALAAANAKNYFDSLTPSRQRAFILDLIQENLRFS